MDLLIKNLKSFERGLTLALPLFEIENLVL